MLIYVAGSIREIGRVKRIQELVKQRGHELTYDWTDYEIGVTGSEETLAGHCLDGVLNSDMLVYVMPFSKNSIGALVEVGIALGQGLPIVVIEPQRHSSFFTLGNFTVVKSQGEFNAAIPEIL